jgi:effector-binding domain-containing protein
MTQYASPNFTQVPHLIIDSLMATMPNGAFKCMMVIFRHTLGWQRRIDEIPLSTFTKKTGLSKQCVINSIEYIEEEKLAVVHREGTKTNKYEILIEEICEKFKKEELVNSVDKTSQLSGQALVNSVDKFSESLKKDERKVKETTTGEAQREDVVVLFKGIDLDESAMIKLSHDYSVEHLKKAVRIFHSSKTVVPNPYGFLKTAIENDWKEPSSREEAKEAIANENKTLAVRSFGTGRKTRNKDSITVNIEPLNTYLEIVLNGQTGKCFYYNSNSFRGEVNKELERAGVNCKI